MKETARATKETVADDELLEACRDGQLERAQRALDAGAQPDRARDGYGSTPLILAATKGHAGVVDLLIEHGADADLASDPGVKPLAVAHCRTAEIFDKLLAAGADLADADLRRIVEAANPDLVARVLEAGKLGERAVEQKAEALNAAAALGDLEIVELLIGEYDAEPGRRHHEQTPLGNAARHPSPEVVSYLLEAGAPIVDDQVSALRNATTVVDAECVRILIEAGADVDQADHLGRTPLLEAVHFGHHPDGTAIVSMLIAAGADVDLADGAGMSPLHLAARHHVLEIAALLIEAGADVAALDDDDNKPLDLAIGAEIVDTSLRRMVRMPTSARDDPYYEVCVLLLEAEREAGLLTGPRRAHLVRVAEAYRCPELLDEIDAG